MYAIRRTAGWAKKAAVMTVCGAWLVCGLSLGGFAQGAGQGASRAVETTAPGYRLRVNSDLVLVNVSVRDKHGNLIRDLKQSDFTVLEDGKAQPLRSFDVEDVERFAQGGPAQVEAQGTPQTANLLTGSDCAGDGKSGCREAASIRDRRLIVLLFDLTNMEPDELNRASQSALHFIDQQMTPADLVAVVSFSSSMQVNQDFTSDHELLSQAVRRMQGIEGQGMDEGTTGSAEGQPDQGQAYTEDDTEYNIFNTDRRLQAIASLAKAMQQSTRKNPCSTSAAAWIAIPETKISRSCAPPSTSPSKPMFRFTRWTRADWKRSSPAAARRSASLHGQAAYNGNAITSAYDANFKTQETLVTLASDTGGKAFLDSNDFSKAFTKVQADMESYYVLGYRSSNPAMDGHYRKITVKVNRPDVKLDYRRGYYGPRDFRHFTQDDRERQMEAEMNSDLPNTDLPVYLSTQYFRTEADRFFVLLSAVVPGSAIPSGAGNQASLDVLGLVRDQQTKFPVGNIRQTIRLAIENGAVGRAQKRAVQHRIPASFRQISSEVRGAGKPEWQAGLV